MIYLGIDGGGSKTRFLLVDNDRTLAGGETGPSNWSSAGPAVVRESLAAAVRNLPEKPDVVCGGFAGAARPEAAAFYRETLQHFLPKSKILIETDALIAYIGAIGFDSGLLLAAGTGSIVIGRTPGGEMIRVGGWGPYFGDEGSGYWIGREAVRTALRANDAGEYPEFVRAASQGLGLESITDVIAAWTSKSLGVPAIAALATEILRQYPAEPARRIVQEAAIHLRGLVEASERRIQLPSCKKSVTGSVGSNAVIQELIGIPFSAPIQPPEYGAITWARSSDSSRR